MALLRLGVMFMVDPLRDRLIWRENSGTNAELSQLHREIGCRFVVIDH